MSNAEVKIEIIENGLRDLLSKLSQVGTAATQTDSALKTLRDSVNKGSAAMQQHAQTVNTTTAAVSNLKNQVAQTAAVNKQSFSSMTASARSFNTALASIGVSIGLKTVIDDVGVLQTLMNKLRLSEGSESNAVTAFKELSEVTKRSRGDLEAITTIYGRNRLALEAYGYTQQQVMKITETLAKATSLSSNAQEAKASLIQLSQAFASGKLAGDEFRSVMENNQGVARALANGLGVTVGQLRQMSKDGELTGDVLAKAFEKSASYVDNEFAKTLPTVTQGINAIRNAWLLWLDGLDKGVGIGAKLSSIMMGIANNMNIIMPLAISLGAALSFTMLANAITSIGTFAAGILGAGRAMITAAAAAQTFAVGARGAMLAMGPFGIGLAILTTAMIALSPSSANAAEAISAIEGPSYRLKTETELLTEALNKNIITQERLDQARIEGANSGATAAEITKQITKHNDDYFTSLSRLDQEFAIYEGALGRTAVGNSNLEAELRKIIDKSDGSANSMADVTKELNALAATNPNFASIIAGFAKITAAANGSAAAIELARSAAAGAASKDASINMGDESADSNPYVKAARFKDSQIALAGRSSTQKSLDRYKESLQETAKKSGLSLSGSELSDTAQRMYDAEQNQRTSEKDARKAARGGGGGGGSEKLTDEQKNYKDWLEEITGPQQQYEMDLRTIRQLLDDGKISQGEYNDAIRETNQGMLEGRTDAMAGFQRGLMAIQDEVSDTASMIEDSMTKAFKSAEDAFVKFVQTGKLDFKSLVNSILGDMARMAFKNATNSLMNGGKEGGGIMSLFGGGGSSGGGLSSFFGTLFGGGGGGVPVPTARPGFATGGSFTVGDYGGSAVDNNMVSFRASAHETVSVDRAGVDGRSKTGGNTVNNIVIQTPNAESFRANESQILGQVSRMSSRNRRMS